MWANLVISYIILVFVVNIAYIFQKKILKSRNKLTGCHVLIIGGSEGLGYAFAKKCVRENAIHVSIISRSKLKLEKAMNKLILYKEKYNSCTNISIHSSDATNTVDIQQTISNICKLNGNINVCILNAGFSVARELNSTTIDDIESLFRLNAISTVVIAQFLLKLMKQEGGTLLFVCSESGIIATYGFSVYAATKFAIRGFVDALNMEYYNSNIHIAITFPPAIDTPGFHKENLGKPALCKKIESTTNLFSADKIADKSLSYALCGEKYITFGKFGLPLLYLLSTTSQPLSILGSIAQIISLPICRLAMICFQFWFSALVGKEKYKVQ
ncbi:oxidoreductase, short chain dehydrogenase/reductase family protein [Cryptosporidium muris RN66]|uniref:Oxidoreductase, short chain dehydrogenase/reductase family protein n=1 Tax=Cryptosporidium muris (strain RN66) TaxID=441375 RepID=B6AFI5_CRYMR|nr:oxidoreductase, short chain dehydrogenase/reductase family protein [Cryptosporidium muris RN66]EEA06976.1 oxidoreductase, short chain dehydrogenase/reductase family protein [Cryptosporidium muris RN66]|eukprot:XP_002141325.1 oxidoreductase, short chain dehydrogenase/reductase family protein [Cryptosporidium muris RN66]